MDKDFDKLHSQFGMTGAERKGLTAATYNASEENKGTVMDNVGTAIGQIVDNVTNSPAIDRFGPISINDNKSLGEQQQDLVNQIGNALEPIKLTPPKEPNFFDSAMQRFFGKSESQLRAEEALQIAQKLNIGADTVMNTSDEGFKHARVIADRIDRGETLESIQTNYPELATLKYESQADAINTLANMENIKQTRGIFDSIEQNTSAMNDQMKLGSLGTKLAFASENEKGALLQQINEISNRLQEYRKDDDSNFFGRIVGDTAAQVYMMGKQALVGGGIGGAIGAAGGAVLGAAIGKNPATAGQFALQGAKLLGQAGMAEQMGEMSFGLKYIELVNKKDTNGNRVYSDSEARNRAAAYAAVDTGIEFYAMRLGAKAITKATPASQMASKTLTTGIDTSVATMNKGMGTIVGQALKRGVKAGIPELVEEGLQDVNEKVQHNLFRNDNDMEGLYSAGDIATGAIGAMWNAAPLVVGLAGLGGIAGGVRMANDFRKWNNFSSEQKMLALQEEQNRNAAQLMANIRKDSLSNQFAKQNAETYSQLVQKYAQKNNIPTAYINMHEMMETPEGQKAVREMVESGIVTDEQVANSIEAETPIEVPIGTFAQHSASLSDDTMNALQDTTFYTEGGQSMRTITKDKEAYATAQNDIADELKNHKASVKADLIKEYFGDVTPTQKEVLDTVLDDADSVKQTYNATVLQAQTDFFEKYNQEYQAYKQAKENGTLENSSDYVITNQSQDTEKARTDENNERMAVVNYNRNQEMQAVKGDAEAEAAVDAKYQAMTNEANQIHELESMADTVREVADNEVAMRMNFTKEGYEVFKDIHNILKESSNKQVAEQAKSGAVLFASHADVMANIMQKAGKWDFTAKDYMDQYISIRTGGVANNHGLTQEVVASAESKLKADTKAWGDVVDKLDSYDAGAQVRVMTTPLAMQLAGAKPYEVVMGVGKIRKILKDHPEITKDGLKNLIQQLADPIAVFESKTEKNSVVAIVQLKYPVNNANVIIPIKLDADERNGRYKVNVITSIYSKTNKHTLEPNTHWYTNHFEGKAETARYLNKEKITDWYSSNRLQLPSVEYHISDFFNYNIPNEEDLRKLKEKNPEFYQSRDTVRGMTSLMADDRKIVDLFETADFSTFVHESGHVFLEDLHMLATMENAPEQVVNDWEEVKSWTGYVEGADADTNREAHEKFARGFEAYVRDGSAPTKPLQRAFRQFAKWLTGIYQTFKMLGGKPPKNIRDVMDRMLATDKDIETWASDREIDRMETKANLKKLSEVEQRALNQKVADIKDKAKELVRSEYLKELEDRAVAPWEDVKDEAKARIEKQLADQYPIYKERARYEAFGEDALVNTPHPTLEALEKAEMVEGIGKFHDVVAEQLAAAEETYNASNRTGVDNASLAEEWLLTHEAEQRLRIAEAEMMKAQVQKASARHYKAIRALDKLDFEHGNLENQIKLALGEFTDKEEKDLIREIAKANTKEEVQSVKDKLQEQLQRLSALRNMHTETLNAAMKKANARMEKLTISQATKYKQYVREGVTFGKKADIAFSRGHVYEAYDLKQKQLMRSAMSRVSFEINQEVTKGRDKLLKQLQRISRSKDPIRLGPEARYWYQHMMYQLGLVSRDGVMPADGSFNVTNVYAVLNPDVLLSNSSQQIVNTEVPQSVGMVWFSKKPLDFNQLTVEEYREIEEIMTAIYNNGRNEYQASTIKDDTGTAISIDKAASELVKQLDKVMGGIPDENLLDKQNKQQLTDKASHSVTGMALELVKAETILNRFDGGQKGGGVWYRYIYEPINRATTDAKKRSEVAMKWLSAAINNSYSKEELFNVRNKKGYTIGDISSLTKEQVICAALNWGTEANRQRVLETFNTNEVEVEKAFGSILDDKDWNFIETTWNHINSYFDERNAVQERLYGTPMKKEEGLTFTINGREIKGQYYPIVYDPQLDSHAADWQIEDVIKSQMTSNAVMGMGMSATKKRNAVVKGKSLWLSLNVIPNAIEESINHIAMREAVTDVNKLIQNHAVEKAIVQTVGREYHQFLKTWVRDQWQTEISKTSKWDRLLGTLRRNSTFAVMGYRTSTAFLNILNVIPAMGKLGPINAVSAIKSFYFGNYMANRQEVMSKSVFLRERIYNLDKDMKNGLKIAGKSPLGTSGIIDHALWKTGEAQEAVNRYGYFFITETDLMLSMPIWKHEYEAKKTELIRKAGYSPEEIENRAIEAGDRAVRSVFGSGDTKDQAGVQRKNNSLVNIFTPFYSYSNTVFNALLEAGWLSKDSGNWLQLAHSVLFWIVVQSVCETLLRSLWDDDKDDAETIAKKSIKAIGSSAVQGFPIVRDILGAVGATITGDTTTSRGSEVVALSMTSKLSKTIGDALFRQGKVSGSDIGRGLSEVSNRLIPGGFSDTLTDGAWTLAKWLTTNTDASVLDLATAIIMDKKIRTKEEERKFKAYQKHKEHSK